jgi:sucrose-6-phosphate hydrolase SacC (GH32 family)
MRTRFLSLLMLAAACTRPSFNEPLRPQVHFTPAKNWMNDPNGLVFHNGEYHLFYQYNPEGITWGHMSWGHAVSKDLLHWDHLPVALAEEPDLMMYSGSAVVDESNSAGFSTSGTSTLVAIYTARRVSTNKQTQNLAFSVDNGRSWTKFAGNPVLEHEDSDFRDPKVFFHAGTSRWIMAVALPSQRKIAFYSSSDLKSWAFESTFGPLGAIDGIWECPDLFPLTVNGKIHWMLVVNIGAAAFAGGSGVQYFTGQFDGHTFTADPGPWDKPQPVPAPATLRHLENFETPGLTWEKTGTAFTQQPVSISTDPHTRPFGAEGALLVHSFVDGDRGTGEMLSEPFVIDGPFLTFLIGGGADATTTGVELQLEDGEILRAAGENSQRMRRAGFDVSAYTGTMARLRIYDHSTGGWGYVTADDFQFTSTPAEHQAEPALWLDYGRDYYAAVSWNNIPGSDGRRLMLGWMSNWLYANQVPTTPWRSAMAFPREIMLIQTPEGLRARQQPARELEQLRGKPLPFELDENGGTVSIPGHSASFEVHYTLDITYLDSRVNLFSMNGTADELARLSLTFDPETATILVERSAQTAPFHTAYEHVQRVPVGKRNELSLRILVDRMSAEVFLNDGQTVITELVLPDTPLTFAAGPFGSHAVTGRAAWDLKSVWK